jgi:hypothetical protein
LFHRQQRVPRGLHGLDLFEKKFKPIELTVDERFKMLREGAAVAGLEFFAGAGRGAAADIRIRPG